MARPIKHQVSELIAEDRLDEAKAIVEGALHATGSAEAGARSLGASRSAFWRWMKLFEIPSLYDGTKGATTRWARERLKKEMLNEIKG